MAKEIIIDIEVNSKKAQKNVKELEKGIKDLDNTSKKNTQTNKNTGKGLEAVGGKVGALVISFKLFKTQLKTSIAALKSLRVAIIATGIGALLIAVVALGQAFTRSEEGQNKFAKILGVIGSVVGNLLDLLADLGENIISAFENPKQALKDFTKLIKENLINRFEGLLELLPKLGKAVGLLFELKFSEAGKVAADAVGKVVLGVDSVTDSVGNAIEKVKEFGVEVAKDAENAARIADLRAEADRLDRKLIVDRAKADRDRATLLEQSVNKEKFTVAERIGFLEEAAALEEKITNQQIQAAAKRLQAQQAENALGKSTKEDKEKEAQLEAELIQLETARLTKQKEVTSQIIAFKAEEAAALKAIADEKAAQEKERLDQKLAEDKERLEEEKKLAQEKKLLADAEVQAVLSAELAKRQIQNATIDVATQGIGLLKNLAGEDVALQKALLIAENAAGIAKILTNTAVANAKSVAASPLTGGQPFVTLNTIGAGIGIASTIAATAKGLQGLNKSGLDTGGGGGVSGGSAPAAPPTPPAFNIVGASGTNQLADAIGGQTQQPVQAYVVANDVTSAQSLDRNIVEGASLG